MPRPDHDEQMAEALQRQQEHIVRLSGKMASLRIELARQIEGREVEQALLCNAAAELAQRGVLVGWVVLHQTPLQQAVVSSIWNDRRRVGEALRFCLERQAAGEPGTEGRYFVAEVRALPEETGDE